MDLDRTPEDQSVLEAFCDGLVIGAAIRLLFRRYLLVFRHDFVRILASMQSSTVLLFREAPKPLMLFAAILHSFCYCLTLLAETIMFRLLFMESLFFILSDILLLNQTHLASFKDTVQDRNAGTYWVLHRTSQDQLVLDRIP